jgi:5-methylcytosine-specific restriction protein A
MRWQVGCKKNNGELRAQFSQWSVPAAIRAALHLKDGDNCEIKVSLGSIERTDSYRLTSGGEFRLPNAMAESLRKETNSNQSRHISFELVMNGMLDKIENDFEARVRESSQLTDQARKHRLSLARKSPESYLAQVTLFRRNPDVVAEVLKQAMGVCQQCKKEAPFIRLSDGSPYLEVHHKKRLSEGGEDTVKNAIALCPNCHRKNHFGFDDDAQATARQPI